MTAAVPWFVISLWTLVATAAVFAIGFLIYTVGYANGKEMQRRYAEQQRKLYEARRR